MRRIVSFHVQCENTQAEEYINKKFLVKKKKNLLKIMSKMKLRKKKKAKEIDS